MDTRFEFKLILSPDEAFPAYRSPLPSLERSFESFDLPFPFPPLQESDVESLATSDDFFDPFSIDHAFPPAASPDATSFCSSIGGTVSFHFIDSDESEHEVGSALKELEALKHGSTVAHTFTFRWLTTAAKNFRPPRSISILPWINLVKTLLTQRHKNRKPKFVIRVALQSQKCKKKVMIEASKRPGVESLMVDMQTKQLVVVGEVDIIALTKILRKKVAFAELLSVTKVKIPKKSYKKKVNKKPLGHVEVPACAVM